MAGKEDRILELEAEVRRLNMENAELKNKLKTEEPYDKVYNERQDLQEQHGLKTLRIQELESQQKSLHKNIEDYMSGKTELEGEVKRLKAELVAAELRERTLNSDCDQYKNQVIELEKHNSEFEEQLDKLKEDFENTKAEKDRLVKEIEENKQQEAQKNMMYIEELRKDLREFKAKSEAMMLESEALKSENESLFRANEAKKEEINEIQKDVSEIRKELQLEKLRYTKLKQELDEEKSRTEFVLVSKDNKRKGDKKKPLEPFQEEYDSENEHVVGVIEAAKAEREELKMKEKELKRRVSQLQTDKEELFRSGTRVFTENKTLKNKFDTVVAERTTLLQVESALKRRVRDQKNEISDLKKTIDDLYQQNMTIRDNEENENKTHAYVVLMGNEMIKQLEREKSALHRRVKFLEKENNEIESRVVDLERQSKQLVDYSLKHDRQSPVVDEPPLEPVPKQDDTPRRVSSSSVSTEISRHINPPSRNAKIAIDLELVRRRTNDYRMPSAKGQLGYRELSRMSSHVATKSPDYYKTNEPTFQRVPSRQPSVGPSSVRSIKGHESRLSLPKIHRENIVTQFRSPSPRSQTTRKVTPLLTRE